MGWLIYPKGFFFRKVVILAHLMIMYELHERNRFVRLMG